MNTTDPDIEYLVNTAINLGVDYIKIIETKSQTIFIAQFDNESWKGQPVCLKSPLNVPTANEPSMSSMNPPSS